MIRSASHIVQPIITADGVLSTRPESASDEPALFGLFDSVKRPDLARLPVGDGMKAQLLRMQYNAMTQSYRASFPTAAFDVVLLEATPIGRLITDMTRDRIHVVYIALLPNWQRRGIATRLMSAILDEARVRNQTCEATVALDNIASLHLWARLGFTELARDAANVVLQRSPSFTDTR